MHPPAKSNWPRQQGLGCFRVSLDRLLGSEPISSYAPDINAVRLAAVQQNQHSEFSSMEQTMAVLTQLCKAVWANNMETNRTELLVLLKLTFQIKDNLWVG